jgi:hypothetical protein
MAALSSSTDANTARSAQIGAIYFAGRIKAREPAFDFTARLKATAAAMNGKSLQPEVQRCAPMVSSAMNQLDGALSALSPHTPGAQAPAAAPAPAPPPPK